jgi:hypothetical protein
MLTQYGHLTYCSNIHPGESWNEHFLQLQQHVPLIKQKICGDQPFGIGLRLSNTASLELRKEEQLLNFKQWLQQQGCYVFTMNGFPYGGFHRTRVKDDVHTPDWTTSDRVQYTVRLAQLLAALLPGDMDGGISTSPLSYKHWHSVNDYDDVFEKATFNLLHVVEQLIKIKQSTGKLIHIDLEPEPDGLMETGMEFIDWFRNHLLRIGVPWLRDKLQLHETAAVSALKEHVCICYDVCHFAVGYEDHKKVIDTLELNEIRVGKIQISAALKGVFSEQLENRKKVIDAFSEFNEPVYLHQVVAKNKTGALYRYPDLPEALSQGDSEATEWRAHFHVPIFVQDYGYLQSTQVDIRQVLWIHMHRSFTNHLEIETYTWDVLPPDLKLPMTESIIRECEWVLKQLTTDDLNQDVVDA